jgi:hypothetical protein
LLRGVFHFKFATVLPVSNLSGLARAFARIPVRPASRTKTPAFGAASQAHRQRAQQDLLRQVRHVEPVACQDVALSEGLDFAPVRRIEPLVHVDVQLHVYVFEAAVALTMNARIDTSLDDEHTVRLAQLELNSSPLGEEEALKGFNRHLIVDYHELPAACEEPANIDLVRTIHRNQCAAA